MRYRLLALVALLALGMLAACGGSASTTATTAPTSVPTTAATVAPTTAPTANVASAVASTVVPTRAASSITAATSATSAPTTTPTRTAPTTLAAITPAASVAGGSNIVMVQLQDFMITLDKSTVSAGMVTFTIKNNGPSPHNFNVKINGEEKGIPTLDPGMAATLTLDLTPGTYDYRCNIPGHDLLGMKGTLTVK
ncbi:MAG: cupredoxin domain-containing protein [Thermomicrobiales bacterium]